MTRTKPRGALDGLSPWVRALVAQGEPGTEPTRAAGPGANVAYGAAEAQSERGLASRVALR